MNVFDYVKSILNGEYIDDTSFYIPYIVNKALSLHKDCLFYVNEINTRPNLDKKLQYDYLYYSIKKIKRPFKPWIKKTKLDYVNDVMTCFNCSEKRAIEYVNILTIEQLNEIKNNNVEGGIK